LGRTKTSLKGAAPLTVRRKYACLSSFFGFLQDMGHAKHNPARRLLDLIYHLLSKQEDYRAPTARMTQRA
jgi:hypothetical protein